jgi:protein tyrosine/serine phosphatase
VDKLRPWGIATVMFAFMVAAPFAYYRCRYNESKRLRIVTPGVLYRGGQMTARGLEETIRQFGIKTIMNVQNEAPDPHLDNGERESELAARWGVRFVFIAPDLIDTRKVPAEQPKAIAAFLEVMDDPANHPVLLHCRAGLHRTGVLAALFRREYEDWSIRQAMDELRDNGFGRSQATVRNDYVLEYVVAYQPRRAALERVGGRSLEPSRSGQLLP